MRPPAIQRDVLYQVSAAVSVRCLPPCIMQFCGLELEVVERSNHGLTVGYVPLGADATVAEGSVDFRFRNNLDAPIYIEAYTYGGEIYVNIYGHETRSSTEALSFTV